MKINPSKGPIAKNRGFSLLEVIVALTILSISLGILLQIFSSGQTRSLSSQENYQATLLAKNLMQRIGQDIPLQEGSQYGEDDRGYRWNLQISPYENETLPFQATVQKGLLYEAKISLQWRSGTRDKQLTLNHLKFQELKTP